MKGSVAVTIFPSIRLASSEVRPIAHSIPVRCCQRPVAVCHANALARDAIDIRRLDIRGPHAPDIGVAHVIDEQENDVRRSGFIRSPGFIRYTDAGEDDRNKQQSPDFQ